MAVYFEEIIADYEQILNRLLEHQSLQLQQLIIAAEAIFLFWPMSCA